MGQAARRLRELVERDDPLVCPGVNDPLTAKIADEVGFDALYMSGYGTSLTATGYPDAGLVTMREMVGNADAIQEHVGVPLIADCDNGYGNATNVVRAVREYLKTGTAGIHIEDQASPKRCGHTGGRRVVPREEAVGKIRAAADVRDERDPEFVIIGRTDARGAVDGSLTEAIERANAFLAAGADVGFVEGPTDRAEVERVAEAVDGPLLYNLVGDVGDSPYVDPGELDEMGYDVVIFPTLSMLATITGVYEHLDAFKADELDGLARLDEAFEACPVGSLHEFAGFPEIIDQERTYMPDEEQEKYEHSVGEAAGRDADAR